MNLTNSEMKRLYEWSQKESKIHENDNFLKPIDDSMDSYWEKSDNEGNVIEYDFNSITELRDLLNMDNDRYDLMSIIAVATFKYRQDCIMQNEIKTIRKISSVPEFVYTI